MRRKDFGCACAGKWIIPGGKQCLVWKIVRVFFLNSVPRLVSWLSSYSACIVPFHTAQEECICVSSVSKLDASRGLDSRTDSGSSGVGSFSLLNF